MERRGFIKWMAGIWSTTALSASAKALPVTSEVAEVTDREMPMPLVPTSLESLPSRHRADLFIRSIPRAPSEGLSIQLGYKLVSLFDRSEGRTETLDLIKNVKTSFAEEMGYSISPIHIHDDLALHPNAYRIQLNGVTVVVGRTYPGKWLAFDSGGEFIKMEGEPFRHNSSNCPAIWIGEERLDYAKSKSYAVFSSGMVIASHLESVAFTHAAEIFDLNHTRRIINDMYPDVMSLVQEVSLGRPYETIHNVFEYLIARGFSLHDRNSIMKLIAKHASKEMSPQELALRVMNSLDHVANRFDSPPKTQFGALRQMWDLY
jgi:flagellar biosynthesis protein FlhA